VSLRPATGEDRAFLYEVYASTRQEELAPLRWDEATTRTFLTMQFDAQDHHYHTYYDGAEFLVILVDDRPAGRLYVARWQTELRLMDIALLPPYRNAGIGTALIKDLMEEARRTGHAVRLHVEPFNPAMRLYQRLGFSRIGEEGIYWFMQWMPPTMSAD
jgi:ribosomal protein S18 acetylase RimI-like enzyme